MINPAVIERKDEFRQSFDKEKAFTISDIFDLKFAEHVYENIIDFKLWEIATIREGKPFQVSKTEFQSLANEVRAKFLNDIFSSARCNHYQYFYEFYRLIGADAEPISSLNRLVETLKSKPFKELLAYISNSNPEQAKVDAKLTRYVSGNFLLTHTDEQKRDLMHRKCAYVYGVTKNWNPNWGGILTVQNKGEIMKTFLPSFNQLNLMSVPIDHFVSQVSNYCPKQRLSVTGWLWEQRKP